MFLLYPPLTKLMLSEAFQRFVQRCYATAWW